MADYFRDPETGEYFVRSPRGDMVAIEPQDVEMIEQGGAGKVAGAAVRGLDTMAQGLQTLRAQGLQTG